MSKQLQKLATKHRWPKSDELESIASRLQERFDVFQGDHSGVAGFVDWNWSKHQPRTQVAFIMLWIPFDAKAHAGRKWLSNKTGPVLWPLRQPEMELLGDAAAAVMDPEMVLETILHAEGCVIYYFLPARCAYEVE